MSAENIGSITYILKSTAGASCDNSLVNIESAILNLIRELEINLSVKAYKCLLLAIVKNIFTPVLSASAVRCCNIFNFPPISFPCCCLCPHFKACQLVMAQYKFRYRVLPQFDTAEQIH